MFLSSSNSYVRVGPLSNNKDMKWSPCEWDWCPYKKGHERDDLSSPAVRGYNEKTDYYDPGRGTSPGTELPGVLILDFPVSTIVRNKFLYVYGICLCLWHMSVYGSLSKQPELTGQWVG